MKRTYFTFLSIIVFVSTIFISCGSDDDDNRTSHTFTAVCEAKFPIRGYAGDKITSAKPTIFLLNDMLKEYEFTPPVISGKLYPNKDTAFEIVGLKENMTIKEITIVINGLGRTYKNVNATNANFYTADLVDYMNRTFNNMINNQQLSMLVTITLDQDIQESDNVYIKTAYDGEYTYLK